MEKMHLINTILDRNQPKKSLLFQMRAYLSYYFWLHLIVRKKSHKTRIIKAKRIFHLMKRIEFKVNPGRLFAYIRTIDPFIFEELLLMEFQSRGFKVIHNKRYTGDGGIDGMVILPSKKRIALQAKRYQNHINAGHLKDFATAINNNKCIGGFFIHCGKTGAGAYQNIPSNIILISGSTLHRFLTEG